MIDEACKKYFFSNFGIMQLIRRNGYEWRPIASEQERAVMVERLASREVDEEAFAAWLEQQIA